MRSPFHKYLAIGMLFLFLIGSLGISISKHACYVSGESQVSVASLPLSGDCCADEGCKDEEPGADCCSDDKQYAKLDTDKNPATERQVEQEVIPVHNLFISLLLSFIIEETVDKVPSPDIELLNISGPSLLIMHQVFRL